MWMSFINDENVKAAFETAIAQKVTSKTLVNAIAKSFAMKEAKMTAMTTFVAS